MKLTVGYYASRFNYVLQFTNDTLTSASAVRSGAADLSRALNSC